MSTAAVIAFVGVLSTIGGGVARAAGPATGSVPARAPAPRFGCDGFVDNAFWGKNDQALDVLVVTPNACGRLLWSSGLEPLYEAALSQAEAKAGRATPNRRSMYNQLVCHANFAITKPVWDLEPARPDVGYWSTVGASCNPTPIWVGQGASNQQAYLDAFDRAGRIWYLGRATNGVHWWGPGCIQDFAEGSRGNGAIMSRGCTGGAAWIANEFWKYYAGKYPSNASSVIGFPYNESHRWGAGWVQDFNGGSFGDNLLMQRDGQSAIFDVRGAIRAKYIQLGGANGSLGFPTSEEYAWNGVTRQDYLHGSILWDSVHGARLLPTGAQQLVFYDKLATPGQYSGVNSILVSGLNQYGSLATTCVNTPGYQTVKAGWWWTGRTYVYTFADPNCTGRHPTVTLWIDVDGRTPYRCLIDTAPYTDWSC